jgi:hypothetical protein
VAYLQVKYSNPKKDSLLRVDSLWRLDSAAQWSHYFDSLDRVDSLRRIDSASRWNQFSDSLTRTDSLRRIDSIRLADSLRSSHGSGDTTHRDSVVLTQHAKDSISRSRTLDSLNSLIAEYNWLLRDSGKVARDSAGLDTVSLRKTIQKAQHRFDSLLTAPLAGILESDRPSRLAVRDAKMEVYRQDLSSREEEIWRREELAADTSA